MIQFSASTGIKGLIALDTAGGESNLYLIERYFFNSLIIKRDFNFLKGLIARWNFFDHAAHLGGMLSGIWYCHQGHSFIWDNREPLMTW